MNEATSGASAHGERTSATSAAGTDEPATTTAAEQQRTPEQLRADLGELRSELGDTVEELAHRADVPARVRAKREETVERVQEQVGQAQEVLTEKASAVEKTLRDRPALVGGVAFVLGWLLLSRIRRRRHRKENDGTR